MRAVRSSCLVPALAACFALPGAALAQRAGENAVTASDDAFGTNIGLESSGIYSEFDTRGFSPTKAGNVRVDGIYADTIGVFAGRLRERTTIRVGFAAEDYPFQAPTGIVDHKFRSLPTKLGVSLAWHQQAYGGWIFEADFRLPIIKDHLSLTGGQALSNSKNADGSGSKGHGTTIRPILRFGGVEIAPYIQLGGFGTQVNHPLVVVTGSRLPEQAPLRRFLGQAWAKSRNENRNKGVTVKAAITGNLSFRGGLFRADGPKQRNFNEIFAIDQTNGLASHRLISDPEQDVHSTSGEGQVAWRIAGGRWQHRLIAGYRARNRFTESGGSVSVPSPSPRPLEYGELDPIPEQSFAYGPVSAGTVRQSAILIGYTGKVDGLGLINLGLQRARYRGTFRDGRSGQVTTSRDDLWLYNATLGFDLSSSVSIYVASQKGLEDSGAAPETALNRNEQLPPTRTTQYEGGVRWKFHGGQLVVNAFQITKPYFTFDASGDFAQQGQVRHRGIETSLSGKFGERLTVVAGALLMQPRVTGGGRPAGTPSVFARADINYRTDLLGGLTPLATVVHTGSRQVNAQLIPAGADHARSRLAPPVPHRRHPRELSRRGAEPVRRQELESRRRQYPLPGRAAALQPVARGGLLMRCLFALPCCAVALALAQAAQAQRAGENAVTDADDAFGTQVGTESTGIYSENDARGFNPKRAGNVRIDGIYFDQLSNLPGRLRESAAIRVGFAAETYPFQAPTGIVDNKFRPMPAELGASLALHRTGYWGSIAELDLRIPVIKDRIGLTGGVSHTRNQNTDGSNSTLWGVVVRPILRLGDVEIAPFYHYTWFPHGKPAPLVVTRGDYLPKPPPKRRYLGEDWVDARFSNYNDGVTVKAGITSRLSLRGGLFYSGGERLASYVDIYTLLDPAGRSNHVLVADPYLDVHSLSGEAQLAYRFATGNWRHRLIAGFRARSRLTQYGGSDFLLSRNQPVFGDKDSIPEQSFAFGPINEGRVKQSSILLGYTGRLEGLASINLGLQKTRYRATTHEGRTGLVTRSRDDPWLYNVGLGIDLSPALSLYAATQKGLEDSGFAPENAANSNALLPATLATQYEGGLRWKFPAGQLVVNVFQITKPYFTFDSANFYAEQGSIRNRGLELSLSGHFLDKRLSLLAGALFMQPRVTGGLRPAGTPTSNIRIDANYRTAIFGGLTPTLSLAHIGMRAVSAQAFASLGGKQLTLPGITTVDIGLRQQFTIGRVPASLRAVLHNVFDTASWKVLAANTLAQEERRRFALTLAADF